MTNDLVDHQEHPAPDAPTGDNAPVASTSTAPCLDNLLAGMDQSPLFSVYGMSSTSYDNEGRTVDALLWVVRHSHGMASLFFKEDPGPNVEAYARPTLRHEDNAPTPDAVISTPDHSTVLEAKIGARKIQDAQMSGYFTAALAYGVDHVVTVSNEPTADIAAPDAITHRHIPWPHVVAEAEWLASLKDNNERAVLGEFVRYAANDKTGIDYRSDYSNGPLWAQTWKNATRLPDGAEKQVMMAAVESLRGLA